MMMLSTHIKVIGRYFINSPANPGQKRRGTKAARVVAVEEIIGKCHFLRSTCIRFFNT